MPLPPRMARSRPRLPRTARSRCRERRVPLRTCTSAPTPTAAAVAAMHSFPDCLLAVHTRHSRPPWPGLSLCLFATTLTRGLPGSAPIHTRRNLLRWPGHSLPDCWLVVHLYTTAASAASAAMHPFPNHLLARSAHPYTNSAARFAAARICMQQMLSICTR